MQTYRGGCTKNAARGELTLRLAFVFYWKTKLLMQCHLSLISSQSCSQMLKIQILNKRKKTYKYLLQEIQINLQYLHYCRGKSNPIKISI